MKLVIIGNFEPSHSTENDWRRSFEELGHDVCCVQENQIDSVRRLGQRLRCEQPAAVMYVRTWGLPAETTQLWRDLEADGIVTFAAHLDRFYGLDRAGIVARDPMFRVGHYFSADGDAHDWFVDQGVNHHWLPPGVLHAGCYDAEPDPRWRGLAVAFVGSAPTPRGGNYHPEWPHRAELVARLREWLGPAFVHVGNGGEVPVLRGHDLNRFYATVPIIVGDSCQVHAGSRYWSDRVPETWGRGGFLIHPGVAALEEQIGAYPGSCWQPGNWSALLDEIDGWLGDAYARDHTRERIAAVVRAEHTYVQRAQEMLRVMGLVDEEETGWNRRTGSPSVV